MMGVHIKSNQVGDFNVNGRIIYYFGDDKDKSEDQTLNLHLIGYSPPVIGSINDFSNAFSRRVYSST